MFNVSDKYKAAMKRPVQRFRITGQIGGIDFTDKDVLKDSMSLTNQCSGSENVQIGQVYTAELNITFLKGIGLQRYTLKGKEIKLYHGLLLDNGTYEDIPLGIYTVSEANWTASGVVVKAYDNMAKLDKKFTATNATGTIYDLASVACRECKVELAQDETTFSEMPNGTEILNMYEENDIETWRDFLSWLSQTAGSFVTADRYGKIEFRQYGKETVDTIDEYHRLSGASFSDFKTRYTGISCVNMKEQTTSYYALDKDDGLSYNLGSNPFLQYGTEKEKEKNRKNVLDALSNINYVPFKTSMIGSPAYDLGDIIRFTGGIGSSEALCCITKFDFKYNNQYTCEGVGSNPALATARSKADKDISGIISQSGTDRSTFYIYGFENGNNYRFASETEVMEIDFATVDDTRINVIFSCNFNMQMDGNVVFKIYLDDELFHEYTEYEQRGWKITTIDWSGEVRKNARYKLIVTMESTLFISDARKAEADRKTLWNYADAIVWSMARANGTWSALQRFAWNRMGDYTWDELCGKEMSQNSWDDVLNGTNTISPKDISYREEKPDEKIGEVEINAGGITGVVFGRGLAATNAWNGTIQIDETYNPTSIKKDTTIAHIAELINKNVQDPVRSAVTAAFPGIPINDKKIIIGHMVEDIMTQEV